MSTLARRLLATALAIAPIAPMAPVAAQTAHADASKQLHAAWLREVLDLDVPGALAAYQDLARNRPTQPERWIAVARLAEIERAGIGVEPKPVFTDAPAALRPAFAALAPIPVADLLRRASGDGASLLSASGADADRIPVMRPVTPQAQEWVGRQGLTAADRFRVRERIERLNPRQGPGARTVDPRPANAADILSVELQGRQEQAANLRSLYFPEWKPLVPTGEAPVVLARIRANLDAWSKDTQTSRGQRNSLQRLREGIEQRAATDLATAVAFVARLPLYAERLLAEQPASKDK